MPQHACLGANCNAYLRCGHYSKLLHIKVNFTSMHIIFHGFTSIRHISNDRMGDNTDYTQFQCD
ncbi:hypothetical protein GYH30_043913 [Glycine max]|nr:hypothetical protein GYH30_043913 [Glycine max]